MAYSHFVHKSFELIHAFLKVQNRKELAAVLNEGLLLQSKWIRADRSQPETEVAPAIPKHCRPPSGTSETLPRSRGERNFPNLFFMFTFYTTLLYV